MIILFYIEKNYFSSQILTVKSLEQDIIFSLKKITFPNQSLCASFIILFIINLFLKFSFIQVLIDLSNEHEIKLFSSFTHKSIIYLS